MESEIRYKKLEIRNSLREVSAFGFRLFLSVVLLVICIPLFQVHGTEPPKKDDVKELMQQKLKHSQKILEAIATNDFDSLSKHADELIILSKDAEWKVLKTPRYETYSNDFRRNAEALIQSAKEKKTWMPPR